MDNTTGRQRRSFGPTEINWDNFYLLLYEIMHSCYYVISRIFLVIYVRLLSFRLDKKKYYVAGSGIFTGLTVALYPISVVKTRLQVTSHDAVERNALSVIKGLLKTDGVPGLYKGFGTVIIGTVPARIIFLTALETTKVAAFKLVEPLRLSEPTQAAIANGVAGMMGSFCSQAVFVPIDVVFGGLYRGFGLSVMTYSPSSAVWWASYGASQRVIWRLLDRGTEGDGAASSEGKIVMVQAAGGIFAAAMASCITTPLDTIKTSLAEFDISLSLVMGHEKRPATRQVVRNLIANDGWTGFYRGLGPRFSACRPGEPL
ncbi:hypothetical protein DH2020_037132 [Rehmannia glutinosa]|uniref:Mitochondrial carrier protein n=1 Tax=Rehmannia glutinosa TaxID=99300 RepID=A0ABR0V1V6_REHGL